jgi:hypothetical protein
MMKKMSGDPSRNVAWGKKIMIRMIAFNPSKKMLRVNAPPLPLSNKKPIMTKYSGLRRNISTYMKPACNKLGVIRIGAMIGSTKKISIF